VVHLGFHFVHLADELDRPAGRGIVRLLLDELPPGMGQAVDDKKSDLTALDDFEYHCELVDSEKEGKK
jgi:hypothetical protein